MNFYEIVLLIFLSLATTIFIIYYRAFNFSKNRFMPCVEKPKFPFGSIYNPFLLQESPSFYLKQHHHNQKNLKNKIAKFFCLTRIFYVFVDREYIKYALQSNFKNFSNRGIYYNQRDDALSANLFTLDFAQWNPIRNKLSPIFTAGKMKMMFETLLQSGMQLQGYVSNLQEKEINISEISTLYNINVIASFVFGIDCNCFKNQQTEFMKRAKEIFAFPLWKIFNILIVMTYPRLGRCLGMCIFEKSLNDFFVGITRDVIKHRLKNKIERKDIIQILMELYDVQSKKDRLIYEDIAAQMFIFFAAGFESTSLTLAYCLYELSINNALQSKLRDEITSVLERNNREISYDALMEMKFMTQVIDETLRKYPPVPLLTRKCVEKYNIPDTDYIIDKDDIIFISTWGLHHDPECFPEPTKFDPDRFLPEKKSKLPTNSYIPFGEGPRFCIGTRFATLNLKVALAVLLSKFTFKLSEKTATPIKTKILSFTLAPAKSIYLIIESINNSEK